jgi:hypothetical protein
MNDNIEHEGPKHLFAAALLNDLMVLLDNAAKRGLDVLDEEGLPTYDFAFWSNECAKALGVKKIAP